jgi:hypothetical protein
MGHGSYSADAHAALLAGRAAAGDQKVFAQRECHPLMNPKGVKLRECRDSAEHPHSLGIAFALDVTGSMGDIPRALAVQELPRFMRVVTSCRIRDAQILFTAVGDATCDRAPLQVGQFESTAYLMDQWLTRSYLEGGGGAGNQESYELALYFLAVHTEMDCVVRRGKRGYLFMTGDENPYPLLSRHIVESVVGDRLDDDLKVAEIVAELQKSFVPFFLIPDQGRRSRCERAWRDLFGDHVLCMDAAADVCYVAGGALALCEGAAAGLDELRPILSGAGLAKDRMGSVLRTLEPLAAAIRSGDPGLYGS